MLSLNALRVPIVPVATAVVALGLLVVLRELLDLPNPLVANLAVLGLLSIALAWEWCRSRSRPSATYVVITLGLWLATSSSLLGVAYFLDPGGWVWFQVTGFNRSRVESRYLEVTQPLSAFLGRHPEFHSVAGSPSSMVLPQGEYHWHETVVVPKSTRLTIEPGTTIHLAAGCSLISYSPLVANGTADSPITLKSESSWLKWGVLAVIHANGSQFRHLRLENARQAIVNDVDLPGGMNLICADGSVEDCEFRQMFGKDAIYVRQGNVEIARNTIRGAFKDGIDLDEATGVIRGNLVIDCEDEGIDLSGNAGVDVVQNTIRDRRGGRIAATHNLEGIRAANTLQLLRQDDE